MVPVAAVQKCKVPHAGSSGWNCSHFCLRTVCQHLSAHLAHLFPRKQALLRFFSPPWRPACFLANSTATFVSVTLCRWLVCKVPSVWCELIGPRGGPGWRSWTPETLISMLRSTRSSEHSYRPVKQQLSWPVSCSPCLGLCCVSVLISVCVSVCEQRRPSVRWPEFWGRTGNKAWTWPRPSPISSSAFPGKAAAPRLQHRQRPAVFRREG